MKKFKHTNEELELAKLQTEKEKKKNLSVLVLVQNSSPKMVILF